MATGATGWMADKGVVLGAAIGATAAGVAMGGLFRLGETVAGATG